MNNQTAEKRVILKMAGDFATGGIDRIEDSLNLWEWATPEECQDYLDARVWDGERAKELAEAGISAEKISETGKGYDFANNDISIEKIKDLTTKHK